MLWLIAFLLVATPLVDAARRNDAPAVRALLQQRADVNATYGDGATALHWAAYHDNAEILDLLIAAGARVDAANDLGITPLYLASANGHAANVRALLAKGADPGKASETGVTPLMEAARAGSADTVRALIAGGADVNARERDRLQTALMWAVARQHPAVVRLLLQHGADVHARTRARPLTVMLDRGPRRAVKTAVQDARQIEAGGSTALVFAAQSGDAESARLLLAAGADAGDAAADGNSALVVAAFAGNGGVVRALIEAGADTNAAGAGYTALHAAALRGDLDTVRALLAKGASPDPRLTKGSPVRRFGSQWALPTPLTGATPLLVASTYVEVDIVRALVAAGASPALALADGTTPLMAAAGANIEVETRPSDLVRWNVVDNDTPAVPRSEADVSEAVRLLLDAGADVNAVNAAGDSALHAAAASAMPSVVRLLAERGAVLDVKNKAGLTPLAMTIPRGRQQERAAPPELKATEALLRKLGATP